MNAETEIKIQKLIKETCRLEVSEAYVDEMLHDRHCDIMDKLGFDSLLIVELVVGLEDELDFEFDMNNLDIKKLRHYDELLQYIDECME